MLRARHASFNLICATLFVACSAPNGSTNGEGGTNASAGGSHNGGSASTNGGSSTSGKSGQGGSSSGGVSGSNSTFGGSGGSNPNGGTGGNSGGASFNGGAGAQNRGGNGQGGSAQGGAGGVTSKGGATSGGNTSKGGSTSGGATSGGNTSKGGSTSGGATSGGATSKGGSTSSGGSTSTTCAFPSSWQPGTSTYTTYTLPNPTTACGYQGSNNNIQNIAVAANYAAIPGTSSSDFNTSSRCGACVQIGSAIVTIVDECPFPGNTPCQNNPTGHLDLSTSAASAGNVKGDPSITNQNQWHFVPCPINGNVIVRLKSGNNNEFFVENEILPIASVTCGGQTGTRQSYGAWHFGPNVNGMSCTLTDIAGRSINVTVGNNQGQNVDSGVQFPKCN